MPTVPDKPDCSYGPLASSPVTVIMPPVPDKPPPSRPPKDSSPVQHRPSSTANPNPRNTVTPRPDSESRSTTARPTQDVRSSDSRESRNPQNDSNSMNIPRPESRSTTAAAARSARQDTQDVKSNEREPRKPPYDPNPTINNAPHPASQSTTTTVRYTGRDSQDVKERETKKLQNNSDLTSTTPGQRSSSRSATDHHDDRRSGSGHSSEDSDSMENEYAAARDHSTAPRERELSRPTVTAYRTNRVQLNAGPQYDPSSAQPTRSSKDPHDQHPPGVAEDATTYHYSDRSRPMNAQVPPGHHEQRDRTLDVKQSSQSPGYTQGIMNTITSIIMPTPSLPPPKDRYEPLKDKYRRAKDEVNKLCATLGEYDRELKRTHGEMRHKNHYIDQLHHEGQRMKDSIGGLQNELNNVHQQLEDAKNLSEVRGKELFGAQVFLTKADTLSISEVGEKVTALNEEIFQAAATLGEALIHKRHEVSKTELDAAAAESVQMVGELMTSLLISQSQKPEPDVNPFIVQVVLQIFMVKFCVSKIQSWYPGDSTIGEFLTAIYAQIRSTGKCLILIQHPIFLPDPMISSSPQRNKPFQADGVLLLVPILGPALIPGKMS